MPRVIERMRQPRAHQAYGCNRAILPRQLHHLDDRADALALLADQFGMGMTEKQGGTDVRANMTSVMPRLLHHGAKLGS